MEDELRTKISILKTLLEKRGNKSFTFFEKLLFDFDKGLVEEVIKSILPSYAIVQYAAFNYEEETLFDAIWNIADKLKKDSRL